jgi:tRNA (guanine-N7-)-methyltransferase
VTIRTFKARRGRLTRADEAALTLFAQDRYSADRLPSLDSNRPIHVEIGFGSALCTIQMALTYSDVQWIAIDIHTPGVAELLAQRAALQLTSLFVVEADAFTVIDHLPPIDALHTYFPDPWPKARHHKRRLITRDRVLSLSERIKPGGTWHIATDWEPYAEHISEVFRETQMWEGGVIDRPDRPVTPYEQKAERAERAVTDFYFTRLADSPHPSAP